MKAERRCLIDAPSVVMPHPAKPLDMAEFLCQQQQVKMLVSFGVAGALLTGLNPGTLLLPKRVLDTNGNVYLIEPQLHLRYLNLLKPHFPSLQIGELIAVNQAAANPDSKSALAASCTEHAPVAADMESHVVAQTAIRYAKPFLALRAILDPLECSIPQCAIAALDHHGNEHLWPVLCGLVVAPRALPRLIKLALYRRQALATLRSAATLLWSQNHHPEPDGDRELLPDSLGKHSDAQHGLSTPGLGTGDKPTDGLVKHKSCRALTG